MRYNRDVRGKTKKSFRDKQVRMRYNRDVRKKTNKSFRDKQVRMRYNRGVGGQTKKSFRNKLVSRRVATCKPGKPGLTTFSSETLALFFI